MHSWCSGFFWSRRPKPGAQTARRNREPGAEKDERERLGVGLRDVRLHCEQRGAAQRKPEREPERPLSTRAEDQR